jgi:hypothetical protein
MRHNSACSRDWLGDLDSNQDSQIQNLESYRWTISQLWGAALGGNTGERQKRIVAQYSGLKPL